MALCPECLPPDLNTAQSTTAIKDSLPSLSDVKGGVVVAVGETKHMISQARTWLQANTKTLTQYKNWNITFDKAGSLGLAKDTALAILPLLILGFISAKILLGRLPFSGSMPSGEITKAAAFWALNFALGIGITLTGSASASFVSASAGGTARIIASGLTILLTYLLIRKSRARAAQPNFTMNPQTEIVGTAALLSIFSFVLTSLTAKAFTSSADVQGFSVSGSVSVSVDFYTLLVGPLIISTIAVMLGSHAVKSQKKISDSLNQAVAFLLGATAVVTVAVVLLALKERQLTFIPMFLVIAPTVVLVMLVAASGVPLINTANNNSFSLLTANDGTPIDITHPTLSLALYFGLLLLALLLIGTVMGYRVDPRTYTARSSYRIILMITGITFFLNFFLMFYAFGSASAAFGLANTSKSIAVFAHPLYLIPASILWGVVYVFGSRYLTPIAAEMYPSLVTKVIPKLRIAISDYYLQTPEAREELTPLQKQTKTMQAAKAKSIAKKLALVVIAFFIITGPANHAIANKLSSPTSAVNGFFDSLQSNDAAGALGHISIPDSESSKELLTDKVLTNYIHKPKVTSVEILEAGSDYANAQVKYTLNGEQYSTEISLIKDTDNKLFKIFPVWKISQDILRQMTTYSYDGATVTYGNVAVPAETSSVFLFPGVVRYQYEDPIYTKEIDYSLLLSPYDAINYETRNAALKADAETYIAKRVRAIITDCNANGENSTYSCPSFQDGWYRTINNQNLKTVEHLQIINIQESNSGYSFSLYFDGQMSYPDSVTGATINTKYTYNATTYLNYEGSFMAITWAG